MHTYTPHGVCSRAIHVELDGDTVSHVDFVGGCDGNLKAEQLEGNTCGRRSTSCADQLVHALREAQGAQGV